MVRSRIAVYRYSGETEPILVARMYAWTGNADNAFKFLQKRFETDTTGFHEYVWDPLLEKLRGDPRWLKLRERAGFGPERLAAIEFSNPQ